MNMNFVQNAEWDLPSTILKNQTNYIIHDKPMITSLLPPQQSVEQNSWVIKGKPKLARYGSPQNNKPWIICQRTGIDVYQCMAEANFKIKL